MPFNSKLVVPIFLGLSLVTVSAFVVYYVFRKEEDEEKKKIKTSRVNTIEITVPKSIVPALIGRAGSNIKDIEVKSGARIHFKKFSDKDYDVCIIQGLTQTTQLAETLIHDFIKNQPLIVEDSLMVPGWSCGRIIGSGGETINDISHRSGARVKVEGGSYGDNTTTRQITFRGTKEQIVVAKGLIENCIAQEKCRREIEQSKRTSRHVLGSQSNSPQHTARSSERETNSNGVGPSSATMQSNSDAMQSNSAAPQSNSTASQPNLNATPSNSTTIQLNSSASQENSAATQPNSATLNSAPTQPNNNDDNQNSSPPNITTQDSANVTNNNTINVTNETADMPGDVPKTKHASLKKPEVSGAAIEVYVSAVSSPSRFWVQFVGPQVTQLDELVQTMTDYYGCRDNREMHALREVSVGQVVAGVFRHDGKWYRARVDDIKPNEYDSTQQVADVFYVDYGDSEYVAVHELCELRADLLRLRFQAMECFLAGVKPAGPERDTVGVTAAGHRWDRWDPRAIERFEELTQVARWKLLVSKTCTYKRTATEDGEKEREIPGIKLYDVTEEGEVDIGGVLISEGWALPAPPPPSPRASPARPAAASTIVPFGDLRSSMVLGMANERSERASSLPKTMNRSDPNEMENYLLEDPRMSTSRSVGADLETKRSAPKTIFEPEPETSKHHINGSDNFLHTERLQAGMETEPGSQRDISVKNELKANMNRIDSHHVNLEHLGESHSNLSN